MKYKILTKILCYYLLLLGSCTTLIVQNPESSQRMALGSQSASECRIVASVKKWHALWGLIPLNPEAMPVYEIQNERSYKVLHKVNFIDGLITLLGGFLITITQSSVEMQECNEPYIVVNSVEEKRKAEAEKEKIISEYLVFISKNPSLQGVPVFVMYDQTINMGKVVEITNDSIIIEYPKKNEEKQVSDESDTVLLKTGAVIKGQIVGQDGNTVVIFDGRSRQTLNKNEIKRIIFKKEPAGTEEDSSSAMNKEEILERKELKRSEIKKIVLNPNA